MANNTLNIKQNSVYDRARMDAKCRIQMASDTTIQYHNDYSAFRKPEGVDYDFWLNICTEKIVDEYEENKRRRING